MRKVYISIGLSILWLIYTIVSFNIGFDLFSYLFTTLSILLSILSIWIPTTKEICFKAEDWVCDGEQLKLTISYSRHKLEKIITCELFEECPLYGYQQIFGDVFIKSGNITLFVGKGNEFNGKVVIKC